MITKGSSLYNSLIMSILIAMPDINKWRQVFITESFMLFLSIKGRINFLQLQRYGKYSEQRYRQQFERHFKFLDFNTQLVKAHGSGFYVIAIDPSYVSKAGKKTPGVGNFWSGQAGQVKWGLEIVGLAAIDVENHTGFHLEAIQTMIKKDESTTLTELYGNMIVDRKESLQALSTIVVADAWFSKKPFVDKMIANEFDFISRLRDDARLQYIYQGQATGKRGRPKKYAGKVNPKALDMNVFHLVNTSDGTLLYTAVVYCTALEREVRLVCLPVKTGNKLYFCTNTDIQAAEIFQYYKSRFFIEFIYRDSKQHTGLNHCQARCEKKFYFHTNMALTAVNIAKVAHWISLPKEKRQSFSMSDIKTLNHNALLLDKFFVKFGINPKLDKNQQYIKELITYGTIAA